MESWLGALCPGDCLAPRRHGEGEWVVGVGPQLALAQMCFLSSLRISLCMSALLIWLT